jgi:hypothetical protein
MLDTLFWLAVGAFVGWHVPQPAWAASFAEKLKSLFESFNK